MARHGHYSYDDDEDHIDMRPLMRLGVWGACAVIATGVAVLAGRSEVGAARATAALAALRTSPIDLLARPSAPAQPSKAEIEARELADAVKALTADRDRLAARVATLEHSLSDLTGSIARERVPTASANPPAANSGEQAEASPAATEATPAAAPPAPSAPAASTSASPPATALDTASTSNQARSAEPSATIGTIVTEPQPRPGPLASIQSYVSAASASRPVAATRVAEAPANVAPEPRPRGIAVELAIATNVNALRARWGTLKGTHGALLEGLRPLVAVRPSARPGFTEFHLVAGPISGSDAATRLCNALSTARIPCRPAPFEGQSLELR